MTIKDSLIQARSGARPIDGGETEAGNEKTLAEDAAMKVSLENGAVDQQLHPNVDAGPMSGDENPATRVAVTAELEGRNVALKMPQASKQPRAQQEKQMQPTRGSSGMENCVSNILNGLEYFRAAEMFS